MCPQFVKELSGDGISCCRSVEREDTDAARIGGWEVSEIDTWNRLSGIEAESGFEEV
jgi:hypothetical protein